MVKLVPIIDLDDEDTETLMVRSVSKLADSQVKGFDKINEKDGSFVVPTFGKAINAETVIPKDGETISVDEVTVKVHGHATLRGCVTSGLIEDRDGFDRRSGKHGYIVGDFVWCKIENDPWWPAQVYDSKDASEMALRYREEGNRLLVALFGSGSGSWCLPIQLLPFLENFVEMSSRCNSRSSLKARIFRKAVQEALDEFGRIVETDMICKCVQENQRSGLARPKAKNGGIKAGVLVPEVKVNRLSVPEYEPYKVLAEVRQFAKTLSVGNKLHLAILKRRLSAFYRFKGGYQLALYDEPVYIEGLEEKKQMLSPVVNQLSVHEYEPYQVLAEVRHLAKTISVGNKRHLAILKRWLSAFYQFKGGYQLPLHDEPVYIEGLEEKKQVLTPVINRVSVPEYEPYEVLAEVSHFAKTLSVGNKRRLAILKRHLSAFYHLKGGYQLPLYDEPAYIEGLEEKKQMLSPVVNGFSPLSSGDIFYQTREKKILADMMEENLKVVPRSEGCFSAANKSRKRKVLSKKQEVVEVIAGEDSTVEPTPESDDVFTPRETKKSKYLSPPSKILNRSIGTSSTCKSILKRVNSAYEENLPDEKPNAKRHCPLSDTGIPVNELLVNIQFAAVTLHYSRNNGSFDKVSAFFSAVRNSTYVSGSNYKIYLKCLTCPKQKNPLPSQRKLSPANMESGKTDDFISDVKFATRDLEILAAHLEKYQTELSVEEKGSLEEDIKQIKGNVEKLINKFV